MAGVYLYEQLHHRRVWLSEQSGQGIVWGGGELAADFQKSSPLNTVETTRCQSGWRVM